jgi:hypothetical protein
LDHAGVINLNTQLPLVESAPYLALMKVKMEVMREDPM